MNATVAQTRYSAMVDMLKQRDPEIDHVVAYSKFVVAYLLQQDGPNPGWRKANIEGPVYLVRRRISPWYQLLVKNQFSNNDSLDNLHPDWQLDCQQNYVFYQVEDPTKHIRGLWFHDDSERQKFEGFLESTLEELRSKQTEPHVEPPPHTAEPVPNVGMQNGGDMYMQFGATKPAENVSNVPGHPNQGGGLSDRVTITRDSLRTSLHELLDDDAFMNVILSKVKAVNNIQ